MWEPAKQGTEDKATYQDTEFLHVPGILSSSTESCIIDMNTTNMVKFSWECGEPEVCTDRCEPGEISMRISTELFCTLS